MYESITYEVILQRMLDRVSDQMDKREGSIIYDALAPAAVELQLMYIELDTTLNESFGDTASRDFLIKRAAERGLIPKAATYAVLKGELNIDVSVGSRFSCSDLNYVVTEKILTGVFKLRCETIGVIGNKNFGDLIPIDYIEGLETASLTELLIPGEDEEETEKFRTRYFNSFDSQAFGGNVADYIEKTDALPGVGGCKPYPVWNGGGTVKLVILDSQFQTPSVDLIAEVQEAIDPVSHGGEGLGLAPIGHVVTVVGAENVTINIVSTITYTSGYDFDSAIGAIRAAIDEYFDELRKGWESETAIIVRISQIETRLLGLSEILDIQDTTINASDRNISLESFQIPVRGTVNGA